MLEKTVEDYLIKIVKIKKGLCIKLLPFVFSGLPDRMVLLPGARIHFIELKRPKGGRVSPRQRIVFAMFENLGFPVHILNTKELIKEFFEK